MSSYVKLATEAGDKYLAALGEFQDNFLKTVTAGAERVKAATSATAAAPGFEFQIPTPAELAEANFAFTQKLLKQQKSFVEKLIATTTPPAA
jgi:hypothetical protein